MNWRGWDGQRAHHVDHHTRWSSDCDKFLTIIQIRPAASIPLRQTCTATSTEKILLRWAPTSSPDADNKTTLHNTPRTTHKARVQRGGEGRALHLYLKKLKGQLHNQLRGIHVAARLDLTSQIFLEITKLRKTSPDNSKTYRHRQVQQKALPARHIRSGRASPADLDHKTALKSTEPIKYAKPTLSSLLKQTTVI